MIVIDQLDQLKIFSQKLVEQLTHQPTIILLIGSLGSGKTTLTKYLLTTLQIPTNQVTSPTFTIHHKYHGVLNNRKINVNHFDFYRLPMNIPAGELTNYYQILSEKGLHIIEWPPLKWRYQSLADVVITVKIKVTKNQIRTIECQTWKK